jgi:AmmeMemoRadiSam system protein B
MSLDFMPSPAPDHPGLFIRDPYRFSDAMLIIPPALIECLECFDGGHSDLDLRAALVRITGNLEVGEAERNLIETLDQAGFLENETFAAMQAERRREFAAQPVREPAHAGSAYPEEPEALREAITQWQTGAQTGAHLASGAPIDAAGSGNWQTGSAPQANGPQTNGPQTNAPRANGGLLGIAAPHVSPAGGWQSYQAAYSVLRPEHKERTFVILATSHYGEPEKFGLTRKPFRTPMGDVANDTRLVDWLAQRAPAAVEMEDFCHSFEHTVELQLIFLQHALGANVRILPILCGPFARSLYRGGKPEDDDKVKAFLEALGELREREGDNLFWILGVDMAHMGARYQDRFSAIANEREMAAVGSRDQRRIDRISACDADGFWNLVQENHDDLKWCGSSPFYTFLKTAPDARGELLRYEQWNIDERSVVSFAGMAFSKGQTGARHGGGSQ